MLLSHVPLSTVPFGLDGLGAPTVYLNGSAQLSKPTAAGLLSAVESVTEFSSAVVAKNNMIVSGIVTSPVTMDGAPSFLPLSVDSEVWVHKVFAGTPTARARAHGTLGVYFALSGSPLVSPAVTSALSVQATFLGSPSVRPTRSAAGSITYAPAYYGAVIKRGVASGSLAVGVNCAGDARLSPKVTSAMVYSPVQIAPVRLMGSPVRRGQAAGLANVGANLFGSPNRLLASGTGMVGFPLYGAPRCGLLVTGDIGFNVGLMAPVSLTVAAAKEQTAYPRQRREVRYVR